MDDERNVNKNQRAFFMIFPKCTREDNTEATIQLQKRCVAAANHQHRFIQTHLCVHLYLYIYPSAVPFSISNCTQSHGRRIVCIMVYVLIRTHAHTFTFGTRTKCRTHTSAESTSVAVAAVYYVYTVLWLWRQPNNTRYPITCIREPRCLCFIPTETINGV